LSTSGTVYLHSTSGTTSGLGYNINADKVSLVTSSDAIFQYNGTNSNNCTAASGETAGADTICTVSAGTQNFIWIEGNFRAGGTGTYSALGVHLYAVKYSRLKNLSVSEASIYGVKLNASYYNFISQLKTANNGTATPQGGMYLLSSDKNTISQVSDSNSGYYGLYLSGVNSSAFSEILVLNSGGTGISLIGSSAENVFTQITAANGGGHGISLFGTTPRNDLLSVLTSNNGGSGFFLKSSGNFSGGQFVSHHNGARGIYVEFSDSNKFSGIVMTGNNTTSECFEASGTNPGITNITCAAQGSSNFTLASTTLAPTSSFSEMVTSTDSTNSSNTLGSKAFALITDWLFFSSFYRGWGKSGSDFPNSNNMGRCGSGDTCNIWDFRLKSSDTVLREKSLYGVTTSNDTFTNGSTCPTGLSGATAYIQTDQMTTANTYVLRAFEILGDGLGDDDGLCESSEACIYSPNFGAYQGEGTFRNSSCTFTDGTVTGVTIYGYPTNGDP
jgi:hypothetical protein